MDKHYKIGISIAIAAMILFSAVSFSKNGVNFNVNYENGASSSAVTTTAPATTASTSSTAEQIQSRTEPSTAQATETSTPASEQTSAETNNESQPSSTAPQNGQMSVAEIIGLYNAASAKVKPEASSLTRNYHHISVPEDQLELPGAIQGIGKAAIGTFVKGSDEAETWTDKEDIKTIFPIGGTDLNSKLTEDMIESASCADNGGSYELKIKLYDDKIVSPQEGEGYAGVFNTIDAGTITGVSIPAVTFNKVDIQGVDGSISCTIDKNTSRITEITFSNTDMLSIDVKVAFSNVTAKLALVTEDSFSIAY